MYKVSLLTELKSFDGCHQLHLVHAHESRHITRHCSAQIQQTPAIILLLHVTLPVHETNKF